MVEVVIRDSHGKSIPVNFWDETRKLHTACAVNSVVYIYGAYLSKESSGGAHLTARASTRVQIASGGRPKAQALLASNVAELTT